MKRKPFFIILVAAVPILILTGILAWLSADYLSLKENLPEKEVLSSQIQDSDASPASGEASDPSGGDSSETAEPAGIASEAVTEVSSEPETESAFPLSLAFVGDLYLSDHVLSAYQSGDGITGVLQPELLELGQQADIFMGNEEFPFSNRGELAPDKQFTFRLPPEKVSIFNEMGLDIVSLANNHTLDYGTDALLDTLDTLDQASILRVGAGRNLEEARQLKTIEVRGFTIGFLAASRVLPVVEWNAGKNTPGLLGTYDPTLLLEDIEAARELCDYVVVYVHWGEERKETPLDYQRTMGKQFIDAGADLVIGSHPHVLQGIEYYNGKPIVHSLGNYVFGSSIPKTALLQVDLTESGTQLALVPCTSSGGYTKMITDPDKKAEFYQWMENLSFSVTIDKETGIVHSELEP